MAKRANLAVVETEFSFKDLVEELYNDPSLNDHHEMTSAALARIPKEHYITVLEEILPDWFSSKIASKRNHTLWKSKSISSAKWDRVGQSITEGRIFNIRLVIEPGVRMTLGECTERHLMLAADYLSQKAAETQNRADAYRRLQQKLRNSGKKKVNQLDEKQVYEILTETVE